jgi:NAD(P)-dependent dehydrogenase (short-subunit alcohol dehydrogenase family)
MPITCPLPTLRLSLGIHPYALVITGSQGKGANVDVLSKYSLAGRKAVVTGGNRGLGRAFVKALLEAGADVVFISRDGGRNDLVVKELRAEGFHATALMADLTDKEELSDAMDTAAARMGGIDILVNNAGTCFHADAFDVKDEEWDAVFDLNVKALFNASVLAAGHMKGNGGGSVVNIGSMSGQIVNRPQNQPAYNASKAAVHHLTKSLATEWARFGIRVNAVAPGYVRTEMAPVDKPEFQQHWINDAPLHRCASPEEIAPSVVFLASEAASFITGSVLVADGGYTAF